MDWTGGSVEDVIRRRKRNLSATAELQISIVVNQIWMGQES